MRGARRQREQPADAPRPGKRFAGGQQALTVARIAPLRRDREAGELGALRIP